MQKQIDSKIGFAVIGSATILFLAIVIVSLKAASNIGINLNILPFVSPASQEQESVSLKENLVKFTDEADFKRYLDESQANTGYAGMSFGRGGGMSDAAVSVQSLKATAEVSGGIGMEKMAVPSASTVDRVSETNVQVLGIDEPDIVKTDGSQIYYSQPQRFFPMIERRTVMPDSSIGIMPPPQQDSGKTNIIDALPPQQAKILGNIDKNGDLLLSGNVLIIFTENKHKIYGYDITDPADPREKWSLELKDNSDLIGARLVGDTVYLASRDYIRTNSPCPIEPFIIGGSPLRYECQDIYHPISSVPTDITYNLLSLNVNTGSAIDKASFTGYYSNSVLYMSQNAIFLTYDSPGNYVKILADFLDKNNDLVPADIVDKIRKIEGYDISDSAKYTELTNILDRYTRALDNDESMKLQNEITNRMDSYAKDHSRELQGTGIVKVSIPKLDVIATGKVPGEPLNQFSLDEYEGNLRIATTSNGNFGWGLGFGLSGRNASTSDVYVLDKQLDELGKVLDLGVGERIYSVRFIEDQGYVVTFKQVDPFFVLNLTNPKSPKLEGQLKIPGYSSYLHPLLANVILGVGEEDGRVKLTMFDVSSPSNPKELNTYKLDEYWSEVASTHHAFLQDKKHSVFFLPGSRGGYVFSYDNNELRLEKAISGFQTRRAVFINDFLYIIGDENMTVLDEINWEIVKELDF